MKEDKGILLESGTGEVEILKFTVNNKFYAINVVKVREILQVGTTSKVPNSTPAIAGITLVRGDVVTLIDLKYVLEKETCGDISHKMTLLCEFNQLRVAYLVDEVLGIHRLKWSEIKKPDALIENTLVIGNIQLDDRIYMLLDFEKIVMDINPNTGISHERLKTVEKRDRSNIKLILADDSSTIRKILLETLTSSGFKGMRFFNDGQEAKDYLFELAQKKGDRFVEDVHVLITDVEMPQLDGHTLTRNIKEHPILRKLPVVIFSSLITGDLRHKGEAVGADAQLSKPEIGQLVGMIDLLYEKLK
jgi:two-component system chemotaxis response regulator CheV